LGSVHITYLISSHLICVTPFHLNSESIGATTAGKLGDHTGGWMSIPIPFLLLPFSLSHHCLSPPPLFHPLQFCIHSPYPLNPDTFRCSRAVNEMLRSASKVTRRSQEKTKEKFKGDQIHLVPRFLQSWRRDRRVQQGDCAVIGRSLGGLGRAE